MTQKEAVSQLHDRVRQCFSRHKFKTFGDALGWWQTEEFETREMEAGEQGMSEFSTDILWLTSLLGPTAEIDYKIMGARKVPALKRVKVHIDDAGQEDEKKTRPQKTRRRKIRRRRF